MPGEWNFTMWHKDLEGRLDEEGKFEGRHLIGRDTPIDGGAYLVPNLGEAIVVDTMKYPEIDKLYQKTLVKSTDRRTGRIDKGKILRAVYETVDEALKYDLAATNEFVDSQPANQKIAIDSFLQKGFGVCRHMGIAAAAILEKFAKDGHLSGKVSVDRNIVAMRGDRTGHAWARYTTSSGEVAIIDVAQHYFGTLSDSVKNASWDYRRPEEAHIR